MLQKMSLMSRRNVINSHILRRFLSDTSSPSRQHVDTLIVGGGPVGSSTAYHLAKLRGGSADSGKGIVVVERDPTYQTNSATLSAGGIRQQFSLEENVLMSLYGRDFLRELTPTDTSDVQFVEHGYLFLATTETGVQQLQKNNEIQQRVGCDIHLMQPEELQTKYPWLNVDDVKLGSLGHSGEGWFDPWGLITGLREANKAMGVTYLHAVPEAATRNSVSGDIDSVELHDFSTNQTQWVDVGNVVNAAGAHAADFMDMLAGPEDPLHNGVPVRARKRNVFLFHCTADEDPDGEGTIVPEVAPLTVDQSQVYFRTEGIPGAGNFLCGVSPPAHEDFDCSNPEEDLRNPDHHLFEDVIWPAIYHRVPAFGCIKVKSSWAGYYEYNTVDQNAIIDFHPELPNVLMVNGFSGHGLQHSPASGRAAAELLHHDNSFATLDLSVFRFDRLMEGGTPVYETGIV